MYIISNAYIMKGKFIISLCRPMKATYGGKFFNLRVGGAKGGETYFLRELGESGVGQERDVAEELVDAIAGKKQHILLI